MNIFIVYNTHSETGYVNAFGPEKQDGYIACHHHHQGQKIDHTKRPLLTRMPPPQPPLKNDELLGGGEEVIQLPLPRGEHKKILVKETLLFNRIKMDECAKKRNKQI